MLLYANSKKIKKIREELGLSQHKLSKLSGLGNNAVYRLENFRNKTSLVRIEAIAKILEIEPSELLEDIHTEGEF